MKYIELGKYDMKALENLTEIEPLDFVKKSPFPRLDYILGFIKKTKPEIFDLFVSNLEKNYSNLKKEDYVSIRNFKISKSIDEFEYLKHYKKLAENSLNYFLSLLELSSDIDWENEKIKVKERNYLRSFLIPSYQNIVSLSDTIGKEDAVKIFKIFVTEYTIIRNKETKNKFDTLEELRDEDIRDFVKNGNPGWVRIEGTVENGKLIYRRDTCLWAEAIKDFSDSDFRYLVACYSDFQGSKIYWNKHFILTMKHTIAKGDLYCSCVVHDTRIDWDLTHPKEEFWESIWPLQEWQKNKKKK